MPLPDPTAWVSREELLRLQFAQQGNVNLANVYGSADMTADPAMSFGFGGYAANAPVTVPNYSGQTVAGLNQGFNVPDNPEVVATFAGGPDRPVTVFTEAERRSLEADQRTRNLQGIAKIGALVGGGALASSLLPSAAPAAGGAQTFPYAAGGPVTATPLAAPGTFGQAATITGATTAAGIPAAAGGAGSLSNVPKWLDYALPAVNALGEVYAADKAVDAETQALDRAIAEEGRQFDLTRADWEPWMGLGRQAITNLSDPAKNFLASPNYQWVRSEGMRDIGNHFSAGGSGAQSGNALRALGEFTTNLAAGEFGDWTNRELAKAGLGTTGTSAVTGARQNMTGATTNFLGRQGASRASGVLGKYSAVANAGQDIYENALYRRRRAA